MERFYDCTNCMKTFKVSSVTEPSAEIPETKVSVQLATHQPLLLCRREPSLLLHRQTSLPPAFRFPGFWLVSPDSYLRVSVTLSFDIPPIIDRRIGCGAIDALRLLARWGFRSRYGQITLAGASADGKVAGD